MVTLRPSASLSLCLLFTVEGRNQTATALGAGRFRQSIRCERMDRSSVHYPAAILRFPGLSPPVPLGAVAPESEPNHARGAPGRWARSFRSG